MSNKNNEDFQPKYLYIEDYLPTEEEIQALLKKKQEEKVEERGIVTIDLF